MVAIRGEGFEFWVAIGMTTGDCLGTSKEIRFSIPCQPTHASVSGLGVLGAGLRIQGLGFRV